MILVGNRHRPPAPSTFPHSADCRTPKAEPQWGYLGTGEWERVCTCHREVAYESSGELDPSSPAAEPSWRAHHHLPGCEAKEVAAVVKVDADPGHGWVTRCSVCTSTCYFFWDPDRRDRFDRPVTAEPPAYYRYELAHETVGV